MFSNELLKMFGQKQEVINPVIKTVTTEKELYHALKSNTIIYIDKSLSITRKFTIKGSKNIYMIGTHDITITVNKRMSIKFLGCENIFVQNICFVGDLQDNKRGEITLQFVNCLNCTVDHCRFVDGEDEQLCIKGTSDYFTVSNCMFEHHSFGYHAYSVLVGRDRFDMPKSGVYHITFYQCYFNGGMGRNPRFRNAIIHLLNCYWGSGILGYLIGPENSEVFLDSCIIDRHPHCKVILEYGDYKIRYNNTQMWKGENKHFIPESDPSVSLPEYEYEVIDPECLKENIQNLCGNMLKLNIDN